LTPQDEQLKDGTLLAFSPNKSYKTQYLIQNDASSPGCISIRMGGFGVDLASSKAGSLIHLWSHKRAGTGNQVWRPDLVPPKPEEKLSIAYTGKFHYRKNALNENIYVIFPHGIIPKGLIYIFSTWTVTASGYEKAPIEVSTLIELDAAEKSFVADAGYYVWKGKTTDDWKTFDLEIWHQTDTEPVSTQTVTLLTQNA